MRTPTTLSLVSLALLLASCGGTKVGSGDTVKITHESEPLQALSSAMPLRHKLVYSLTDRPEAPLEVERVPQGKLL